MTAGTARRTSQFTLTIPAPEHADADLHYALDSFIYSTLQTGLVPTGSWISRGPRTLSVSYRAADDDTAAALAFGILAEYAAADPADAHLHTGYGMHRRDFPLDPAGQR